MSDLLIKTTIVFICTDMFEGIFVNRVLRNKEKLANRDFDITMHTLHMCYSNRVTY